MRLARRLSAALRRFGGLIAYGAGSVTPLMADVARVSWGSVGAQAVGFFALVVLARLYTPADFGKYAILTLGAQVAGSLAALRFEQAIMFARSKNAAIGIALLAIAVATCITALFAVALWSGTALMDRVANVVLGAWWPLIALTGWLSSITATLMMLGVKFNLLHRVSMGRFAKVCGAAVFQILMAWVFTPNALLLLIGEMFGLLLIVAVLWRPTLGNMRTSRVALKRYRRAALGRMQRHRELLFFNTPQAAVNVICWWIVAATATSVFGPEAGGQFFMMQRIAMLPVVLVGLSLSQLYHRAAADARQAHGRFDGIVRRFALVSGAIGLTTALLLAGLGPTLFTWFLGQQWQIAGELARIFSGYVAVHFVLATLAATSVISGRLQTSMLLNSCSALAFTIGFYVSGVAFGTLKISVASASAASLPWMIATIIWYHQIARRSRVSMVGSKDAQ